MYKGETKEPVQPRGPPEVDINDLIPGKDYYIKLDDNTLEKLRQDNVFNNSLSGVALGTFVRSYDNFADALEHFYNNNWSQYDEQEIPFHILGKTTLVGLPERSRYHRQDPDESGRR